MKVFIRLAVAGLLISCFEEWCGQGITMMSALLGVRSQAAIYITYSVMMLLFYIPLSFSYAISALVGAALG